MTRAVVIAGAGQAGSQVAASLRHERFDGKIVLVGDEPALPYQRPPLSKAFLAGAIEDDLLPLRPDHFYRQHRIDLVRPDTVITIDRNHKRVHLRSGRSMPYDHLVLALGSRPRWPKQLCRGVAGVMTLRTVGDAAAIRQRLTTASDVVIVGAGFLGLEVATLARASGANVTVIDIQDFAMARVVSRTTARFFAEQHSTNGIRLILGTGAAGISVAAGRLRGLETTAGEHIDADVVLVAAGVTPNTELAAAARLDCADGIVVDQHLVTADAAISAIGDCARYPSPFAPGTVRLESVQNASDQARSVALRLCGRARRYAAVPWFWSEQAGHKLQIAGVTAGHDSTVVRGDPASGRFSVFCFRGQRLAGVESVNSPAHHLTARRLLGAGATVTFAQAGDEEYDLKAHAMKRDSERAPSLAAGTPT